MALQGLTLFCLGYCMCYLATLYLASGLVSVVFTTILMMNILNLHIFMHQPVEWRAFWGGALGLIGIGFVFWDDLIMLKTSHELVGLGLALTGAYLSSLGNIVSLRNSKSGIPVSSANVYAMAYGGLLSLGVHFGYGGVLVMDWSFAYLGPMLYLALFGSVIAFGSYFLLINRIGADFAAYAMLPMPIIALVLSTFYENYNWCFKAIFGVSIVLLGNLVILTPNATWLKLYNITDDNS